MLFLFLRDQVGFCVENGGSLFGSAGRKEEHQ